MKKDSNSSPIQLLDRLKTDFLPEDPSRRQAYQDIVERLDNIYTVNRKAWNGLLYLCLIFAGLMLTAVFYLNVQIDAKTRSNEALEIRVKDLESADSLHTSFLGSGKTDTMMPYRIGPDGTPITYTDLLNGIDSLRLRIDELKRENSLSQIKLELIQSNYDIEIIQRKDMIYVKAPQIDSALMLLDTYRSKLTYDPKTDSWYVRK